MRSLHLFAGIGGGIIGDILAGNEIVGAVEIEPFCQDVLRARQADGSLPAFPILGDIRDVKGDEFGDVELVCGGFPCQDISLAARTERKGLKGKNSGLFYELVRIVDFCKPDCAFLENVPAIVKNGLNEVIETFAERGYYAQWTCLSARDCGAPHVRNRWWGFFYKRDALALRFPDAARGGYSDGASERGEVAVSDSCAHDLLYYLSEAGDGSEERSIEKRARGFETTYYIEPNYWLSEPYGSRVVDGVPSKLDKSRVKALGNAQVPICAYLAYEILLERALNEVAEMV